jgi:hypothetical protein
VPLLAAREEAGGVEKTGGRREGMRSSARDAVEHSRGVRRCGELFFVFFKNRGELIRTPSRPSGLPAGPSGTDRRPYTIIINVKTVQK